MKKKTNLLVNHNASTDGVGHTSELGFVIPAPFDVGHRAGEGEGEPVAHLGRHGVRLHLRQLILLVTQTPEEIRIADKRVVKVGIVYKRCCYLGGPLLGSG